jgi:hypothetical protein
VWIWIALSYVLGPFTIAMLSLWYGDGKWTLLDKTCLLGALSSAVLWMYSRSAPTALALNIVIDFLGLLPTIEKCFRRPWSENRAAWCLAALATVLNVFAIDQWTFAHAAYPVYLLLTNCLITTLLLRPQLSRFAGRPL